MTDAKKLKRETAEVFADARFELHKWHSNVPDLETTSSDDEPTFAKQQLEIGERVNSLDSHGTKYRTR